MKKLQTYFTGINLIVLIVVVNAIALVTNIIPKIDITSNKAHSVSGATREIIGNLDDIVNIKVYLSKELPAEIKPVAETIKSNLSAYSKINPTKFVVKYGDPNTDSELKKEADNLGISPFQYSSIQNDKFEIQSTYLAMAMEYGGKSEVVPIASDIGNLEYMIASTLNRMIAGKLPKLLIAADTTSQEGLELFSKYLTMGFEVTPINLSEKIVELDNEANSMVIVGNPKIEKNNIEIIEKWVESGKGLLMLTDKVAVNGNMVASKNEDSGLEKLLADNGMLIENKLVMDKNGVIAEFKTKSGSFRTQYAYWPQISEDNINRAIPATMAVSTLAMAWVSPISIDDRAEALFWSSDESVATDSWSDLTPQNAKLIGETSSFVLGAVSKTKKLAVIADADFVADQFVFNNQRNLLLALNLVDYVSADSKLTEIRGKNLELRPIKELIDNQKMMVRVVNLASPILILILVFLTINAVDKRKK